MDYLNTSRLDRMILLHVNAVTSADRQIKYRFRQPPVEYKYKNYRYSFDLTYKEWRRHTEANIEIVRQSCMEIEKLLRQDLENKGDPTSWMEETEDVLY